MQQLSTAFPLDRLEHDGLEVRLTASDQGQRNRIHRALEIRLRNSVQYRLCWGEDVQYGLVGYCWCRVDQFHRQWVIQVFQMLRTRHTHDTCRVSRYSGVSLELMLRAEFFQAFGMRLPLIAWDSIFQNPIRMHTTPRLHEGWAR